MNIEEIREDNTNYLLNKNNVCGTATGKKWINGEPTEEDAIIVFVQKKYKEDGVIRKYSEEDIVPDNIEGIPTDVVEVGKITKQNLRKQVRPIIPGYSCGHGGITAGTIGGFFIDGEGSPVILSNNHVLGNENNAKKGDLIYQPGPSDTRKSKRFIGWDPKKSLYIGKLKRFVPIRKKTRNIQDSAIAEVHESYIESNMVNPVYPTMNRPLNGFAAAQVNMQVQKCGRTTGYTTGRIIGKNATFTVEYDLGNIRFEKCIVTTGMSKGGDSGSLIMDMNMNAVGLLFAGSPKVTLANDISIVKKEYGLKPWNVPLEEIDIDNGKWAKFTKDGDIKINGEVVEIIENANHHCFVEHSLNRHITNIECVVDTGSDKGATWGPGVVLQFPNGHIKINLRYNGTFGLCINGHESFPIGKVEPNTKYKIRIKNEGLWVGEIESGGKWFKMCEIPLNVFPVPPVSIRIGKTGKMGSTMDHGYTTKRSGEIGRCTISDIKVK